jgi:glyoxylate reductase
MKIFITRKIPDEGINLLKEKDIEVVVYGHDQTIPRDELIREISENNYDGLVTLIPDKIDKEILDICKNNNVKVITNFAVGLNNIDVTYAESLGIKIMNAKGTSANAVAQHVLALLFACCDRVVEGQKEIEQKKWRGWDPDYLIGKDIFNKTVGLVGCGNIGAKVAEILHHGFNCNILYTDLNANHNLEEVLHAKKVSIEELLKNSDIVSLHVPLLPETTHMINAEKLNLMKKDAILINTARGPVVNETDLIEFLISNKNFQVGLDVFENEPNVNEEFKNLPNVVMTPHISSAKESARVEMAFATGKNILEALAV